MRMCGKKRREKGRKKENCKISRKKKIQIQSINLPLWRLRTNGELHYVNKEANPLFKNFEAHDICSSSTLPAELKSLDPTVIYGEGNCLSGHSLSNPRRIRIK